MRGFKKLIIIHAEMQNTLKLTGGGAIRDKARVKYCEPGIKCIDRKEAESKSSFEREERQESLLLYCLALIVI